MGPQLKLNTKLNEGFLKDMFTQEGRCVLIGCYRTILAERMYADKIEPSGRITTKLLMSASKYLKPRLTYLS